MSNRWNLTDEIRNKFKPILQEYLNKVEHLTTSQIEKMTNEELGVNFTDTGINPCQLIDLLKEYGYEDTDSNDSGWELNFLIDMERKDYKCFPSGCEHLVIDGCGMTFELKLYIDGMDF